MSSAQFGRKESFNLKIKTKRDCPGGTEVKTMFPMQEARVWSLVKELRYRIPYAAGVSKRKKIKTKTFGWLMHAHRNTCQVRNIFSLSTICAYEQYLCGSGEGNGTPLQYSCLENPMEEEPGRLQSMGSLQVGHDWATSLSLFTFTHWRRKWQPTPMFLPGESRGRGSPVGCRLWGRTEWDTTEAI